jgi:hypothetical protein
VSSVIPCRHRARTPSPQMPIAACFTSQVSLEVDPPLEEKTLESAELEDVDTGRTWHGGVLVNYPSPVHFLRRVEGYLSSFRLASIPFRCHLHTFCVSRNKFSTNSWTMLLLSTEPPRSAHRWRQLRCTFQGCPPCR